MPPIFEQRVKKLQRFYDRHKRMPSYSEMLELFSVKSKQAVARVVDKLIEQGLVTKDSTGRLSPTKLLPGVRVLGTVEAGWPSPAEEELVDTISLDSFLIARKDATFMLEVSGESMIDAGIHPGDLLLVERGRSERNGDIVVASVDNEWTVKRYEKRGSRVTLYPANKRFKPIRPDRDLSVAGVVVAVIRKYA